MSPAVPALQADSLPLSYNREARGHRHLSPICNPSSKILSKMSPPELRHNFKMKNVLKRAVIGTLIYSFHFVILAKIGSFLLPYIWLLLNLENGWFTHKWYTQQLFMTIFAPSRAQKQSLLLYHTCIYFLIKHFSECLKTCMLGKLWSNLGSSKMSSFISGSSGPMFSVITRKCIHTI